MRARRAGYAGDNEFASLRRLYEHLFVSDKMIDQTNAKNYKLNQ
jgi:hypothetical protein